MQGPVAITNYVFTNAKMAMITSNEEVPLLHYSHALANIMCNPSLPSCHLSLCSCCPRNDPLREMPERYFDEAGIDEIEFQQWTTTDQSNMEIIVQLKEEFLDNFFEKLNALKRLDFNAKQQANYLNERKENLKKGESLVIADFSENFSFVCQDADQSFHWNSSSATLHPFVYYYKQDEKVLQLLYSYIEDLLIVSSSEAEHLTHLEIIFNRLSAYGVVINPSK